MKDLKIVKILFAAGCSQRMGQCKMTMPWQNSNFIELALETIKTVEGDSLVVINELYPEVKNIVQSASLPFVINDKPECGKAHSLHLALDYLNLSYYDGIICLCADQPMFRTKELQKMINAFAMAYDKQKNKTIIRARYNQIGGNPILFGSFWFKSLYDTQGDEGGRIILKKAQEFIEYVDLPVLAGLDIDTIDEYNKYFQLYGKMEDL